MIAARILLLAFSLATASTAAEAQTLLADRGQPPAVTVRRLSIDEAVRLALENNLGIRVARIDPVLGDLTIAQVRGVWSPSFTSTFQNGSTETPANSFLSGGATTKDARFAANVGVQQTLPWGGSYSRRLGQRAIDDHQPLLQLFPTAALVSRASLTPSRLPATSASTPTGNSCSSA
jgi:outer membrane protein TolC